MKLSFYIIVSIIIILFGAINYFIGLRGWEFIGSKLPFLHVVVYAIVFAAIVVFSFIGFVGNRFLPNFLRSSFYTLGSYWLAALTYFTIILVVIDIIRLFNRWIKFTPKLIENRHNFPLIMGVFVCVFVIALLTYGTLNARNIKVTSYNVTTPKQAGSLDKLRIALISDLHINNINDKRHEKIVDTINQLNPDIVLIAGDIIDDIEAFEKGKIKKDLRKIKSKYGVYASLGNHDYLTGDRTDIVTNCLAEAGINVLRDNSIKIQDSFYIIGREDRSYNRSKVNKRKELSKLMEGLDPELLIIVLDHQPIDLEEAEKAGVDLQLSGHTHKGQFFPFNLITKRIFMSDYGYFETGGLQVIVTSGAGSWGPPVRIGSTPEVVNITVSFSKR